jgi:hypothetical protein
MTSTPICYQLLSQPLSDPATSTILFFIPIDHPNIQKARTFSSWNICLPHQGGLSSILPPSYSNIHLPTDHQKAQLTLAKEILGTEPDLSLMEEVLMDPLNMYKDHSTLVLVVTDAKSDPVIQLALQTFFAKFFLPLRVSWVKMVSTKKTWKQGTLGEELYCERE